MKAYLKLGFVLAMLCMSIQETVFAGVLVVTTTADTGTGSLRLAIAWAQTPGPDSIRFAIPKSDPGYDTSQGTWTIRPKTGLWVITDGPLVIDGTSQAQFIGGDPNPYGPEIEISGQNLPTIPIFMILAPEVEIRCLILNRSTMAAVAFQGMQGGKVSGCYLGTNPRGDARAGNEYGIWIFNKCRDIKIGGIEDPANGNLISGNQTGVLVTDSCTNILITGNRVGTNRTGTDTLGNVTAGIAVQGNCDSTRICNNLVAANTEGILVSESIHTLIANNAIGTDTLWDRNLANSYCGIMFDYYARDNVAADNCIGYGSRAGIMVFGAGSVRNRLTRNEISRNEQRGIETSFGANNTTPPPTITSVTATSVSGKAGPGYTVEVFVDDSSQGRDYRGTVAANASGAFTLPFSNPAGLRYVTATATDSAGNTSEFSIPYPISIVNVCLENTTPAAFVLSQNYPNPFNPVTSIGFRVPGVGSQKSGSTARNPEPDAGHVKLAVYDLMGREVAILVNEKKNPGNYTVTFNADGLASGVYFYKFQTRSLVETKRMLLLR
jgi:hypothetical protein